MTLRNIQASALSQVKLFTEPRFGIWRVFSLLFIAVLGVGNYARMAYGQGQTTAEQSSAATPSPETKTNDGCWKWTSSGKHNESDLAQCLSSNGSDQLELRFYKHEFQSISVWLPEPREVKGRRRSLADQIKKNQVTVTLTFNDAAPQTEIWAIIKDPSNNLQSLIPKDMKYPTLYGYVLRCKTFTITYPDESGKPITDVFDVAAMPTQVQAHNERIHHSGLKDALVAGGLALGSF